MTDVVGSLGRVVLANFSKAPVAVRAGEFVGYGLEIDPDAYEIREVDGSTPDPPVRGHDHAPEGLSSASAGSRLAHLQGDPDVDVAPYPELGGTWSRLSDKVRALIRRQGLPTDASCLPQHLTSLKIGVNTPLSDVQRRMALALLKEYAPVFNDNPTIPSRTTKFRAQLDTGSNSPVMSAPYRTSPAEREMIDKAVDEMLKAGVIRPSRSPWSSPVVLVPKKDGETRFCVDYRRLNKLTKVEVYPLPRVDETLRAFEGSMYFSVMDMQSGYWQVPLHPDSIPKTAFITHRGLHEYVVLPFGPTNAPGYFQRMMDEVMGGLKWSSVLVYIDDLIVFSRTFEAHLHDLAVAFDRLREAGLTLKPKKCQMFAGSVHFLGHVVSRDGIAPDPDKVKAIRDMPKPRSKDEVLSFLGMAGYYRRYVPGFSTRAEPLQRISSLTGDISMWGPVHDAAIQSLKDALCAAPILVHPNFARPFRLMTDASGVGLGAVLTQKDDDGAEHAVEYASRSLQPSERKWSPTELEALAVKWACEVMRPYLYGTKFEVVTDHRALQYLFKNQTTNARLQRWALQLMEYQFDVVHRPGSANANADGPSRLPLPLGAGRGEDVGDDPPARMRTMKRTREEFPDATAIDADAYPRGWDAGVQERRRVADERVLEPEDRRTDMSDALPSTDEFRTHIVNDPSFGDIHAYLMTGTIPEGKEGTLKTAEPYYFVTDGVLMLYTNLKRSVSRGLSVIGGRIVVPVTLRRRVILHHHSTPESGHLGPKPTYMRMQSVYWWPGMWRDTNRLVRSCHACQVRKDPPNARAGLLQPITVSEPWEVVGIDLLGPFKLTPRGNRYALTMIDFFSRWTIFSPLKESKANDVVDAVMESLVHKFGLPRAFLSDQGRQFAGGLFQRMLERLKVRYGSTSGYHPQTNGKTERVHRTLNAMLAAQVNKHHTDWDEYLSAAAWAVNTSWKRSTGLTPYEILFGRPARMPAEVLHGSKITIRMDAKEYNLRLTGVLREVHDRVRKTQAAYAKAMAEYYDRSHKDVVYKPGDIVKLYQPSVQPQLPKRLQLQWTGPHLIVGPGPNAPNNYVVDINGQQRVCHVGRIRPYRPAPPPDDAELPVSAPPALPAYMPPAADLVMSPVVNPAPVQEDAGEELKHPVDFGEDGPLPSQGDAEPPVVTSEDAKAAPPAVAPTGWTNVLLGDPTALPKVDPGAILARHIVWYWSDDDDGKRRWWMGVVWDRPTARNPTLEVQPYNSRDTKKPLDKAAFTLVWWDPRVGKEEWRIVKKPHLQPFIMDVPADHVLMTALEWRSGHRLPESVLQTLDTLQRSDA